MSTSLELQKVEELSQELKDDIKNVFSSHPDLLYPMKEYDEKNHEESHKHLYDNFLLVMKLAFDIPEECSILLYQINNRDLLWLPRPMTNYSCNNYFQLFSIETEEREPLDAAFSYLFDKSDPLYGDPYDFSEEELEAKRIFYKHLKSKYKTGEAYTQRVNKMLFISEYDKYYANKINRLFRKME